MIFWFVCALACFIALRRMIHFPWIAKVHSKCVVITGCDSGFGNALAKSLHRRGLQVFAGCYTGDGARRLTRDTGVKVKTFQLDIGSTNSIENAYEFVRDQLPTDTGLWALVNNAGTMSDTGPVEFITRKDMISTMNINCFGVVEMVRVFLPLLKKSKGRIINTTSMTGYIPFTGTHPYSCSKRALIGYSEALRHEKAMWGIKVSTVCPALFRTNIVDLDTFKTKYGEKWRSLDPEIRQQYGEEYRRKFIEMTCSDVPSNAVTDVGPVIEAFEHALFARRSYTMYYPGHVAAIFVFIQNWLPSVVLDFILQYLSNRCLPSALRSDQ